MSLSTSSAPPSESSEDEEMHSFRTDAARIADAKRSLALMMLEPNAIPHRRGLQITPLDNPYIHVQIKEVKEYFQDCMPQADNELCEKCAACHINALIHLCYVPRVEDNPDQRDLMKDYLDKTFQFARAFILGKVSLDDAIERTERLFDDFIWINNRIDHLWSNNKFVAPVYVNSESQMEVDNEAYEEPPVDYVQYLEYVRKKEADASITKTKTVKIVTSVASKRFRFIQMHFFYEMKLLIQFAAELERRVVWRQDCSHTMNNVGWMDGLLKNLQCYTVVTSIKDKIYEAYVLPGNIREMQFSLKTPLRQLKPRDILFQISSPIYFDELSPYFRTNIGLFWDDIEKFEGMDMECMLWDARSNILLHFFYFLFLKQKGSEFTFRGSKREVQKMVYLASIYTLRYEQFIFEGKEGHLVGFRRRWYLFKVDGVWVFEGFHATENALHAWAGYIFGETNAFTRLVAMVARETLPDAYSTMNNVTSAGTFASEQAAGSIFQ